jgi:hypothetical protein
MWVELPLELIDVGWFVTDFVVAKSDDAFCSFLSAQLHWNFATRFCLHRAASGITADDPVYFRAWYMTKPSDPWVVRPGFKSQQNNSMYISYHQSVNINSSSIDVNGKLNFTCCGWCEVRSFVFGQERRLKDSGGIFRLMWEEVKWGGRENYKMAGAL